jgi:hypothetical protein
VSSQLIYSAPFSAIAVTAQIDIFELVNPSTHASELVALLLAQTTDLGDAAEEILTLDFIRGHTTSGSGGGTITPAALNGLLGAFGGTVERTNTTLATGGTPVTCFTTGWNIRDAGPIEISIPEGRTRFAPSERMVIRTGAAPADSITISGTALFRAL